MKVSASRNGSSAAHARVPPNALGVSAVAGLQEQLLVCRMNLWPTPEAWAPRHSHACKCWQLGPAAVAMVKTSPVTFYVTVKPLPSIPGTGMRQGVEGVRRPYDRVDVPFCVPKRTLAEEKWPVGGHDLEWSLQHVEGERSIGK